MNEEYERRWCWEEWMDERSSDDGGEEKSNKLEGQGPQILDFVGSGFWAATNETRVMGKNPLITSMLGRLRSRATV